MKTRQQRRAAERETDKRKVVMNPVAIYADEVNWNRVREMKGIIKDAVTGDEPGWAAAHRRIRDTLDSCGTSSNWDTNPTPKIADILDLIKHEAKKQAEQREAFIYMVKSIGGKVRGSDIVWIPDSAFWKLCDSMMVIARFSIDGTTMNLFGFTIYSSIKDFYDRLIEDWHNGAVSGQGLSEYMGMSESEYAEWVVNP